MKPKSELEKCVADINRTAALRRALTLLECTGCLVDSDHEVSRRVTAYHEGACAGLIAEIKETKEQPMDVITALTRLRHGS